MTESRSTARDTMDSVTASDAQGAPASTDPQSLSPDSARPRRGSFSFLRRSKSRESTSKVTLDASGSRKLSRRSKKDKAAREAAASQPAPQISKNTLIPQTTASFGSDIPHTSPEPYPPPTSASSYLPPSSRSGYDPNAFYKRHLVAEQTTPTSPPRPFGPVPPMPIAISPPSDAASATQSETMANRGRYSYASSVNSPGVPGSRRVRRRKDPTPFNVLVIGTPHSGKTSFIEFLRSALARPVRMRHASPPEQPNSSTKGHPFSSHYIETELEGERIGLTLWDSVSLEKHIIDIQLREMTAFIEGKFHETFTEESKVLRSTNVRDTHIHCVLFVLDPQRLDQNLSTAGSKPRSGNFSNKPANITGALDSDFEGQVLRGLQGMTTVIPIISKADTITTAHMSYLKRLVWDSFKKLKIDPLEALNIDSDDDASAYETALSEDGADSVDNANSISSNYDNAQEVLDEYEDGDKTPVKANFAGKNKTPVKGAKNASNSSPPHHEEMRVSALSMNVDLPQLPLSIISPDTYDPGTVGRRFPWGFADPYNDEHCDFVKLMDNVFSDWRGELRTVAHERWYENWRTNRLRRRGPSSTTLNGRTQTQQRPPVPPAPTMPQPPMQSQRTVSSAAAYGGKSPETRLARTSSLSNVNARANANGSPVRASGVSASEIGVAVSNGVVTTSAQPPPLPKSNSYRGIGTY